MTALGERGRDFEITSDIEMSVYFTDTGMNYEWLYCFISGTESFVD